MRGEQINLDDIDLFTTELTTAQAAELASVSPGLIRVWKHRGYLQPCSHDKNGWPRFLGIDVARAENATRNTSQSRRSI